MDWGRLAVSLPTITDLLQTRSNLAAIFTLLYQSTQLPTFTDSESVLLVATTLTTAA